MPTESPADFRAGLVAVFLEPAVRLAGAFAVFAVDVAVARFFVADLPVVRPAVDLRAVAPADEPVPCRGVADDGRLAAGVLDAAAFFAVFRAVEVPVPLRAAEPGADFLPVAAVPASVFFVAALVVEDFDAPFAAALLTTDLPAAAFFAGLVADLVAPFLLVDLRGLVVAMRVSLRIGAELRRPVFDNTAAMQAK